MLGKIKHYLYNRELNKYQSTNIDQTREAHFAQARYIGIVFDASSTDTYPAVERFVKRLEAKNREVKVLGYFDHKLGEETFPFDHFSIDDLNFSLLPRTEVTDRFINAPFDILINLDPNSHPPVNYLCAASRALFKVGSAVNNTNHYDLMIEMPGEFDLDKYIFEIRRTLNLIK